MDTPHFLSMRLRSIAFGAAVFAGLYLTRLHGYILFHSLAEIFSVTVACAVFMVAWNARRSLDHGGSLTVGRSRWGGAEFRITVPVAAERSPGEAEPHHNNGMRVR